MDKMYEVSVTLTTGVMASSMDEAERIVIETMGLNDNFGLEFGEDGQILPFDMVACIANEITDEDIGRG
jgi:hypothetical protein